MSSDNLVPPGNYRAKAVPSDKVWIESNNGSTGAEIQCEIVSGPYAGRMLYWRSYFGKDEREDQVRRVIEQMRVAGCVFANNDMNDTSGLGSVEFNISVIHDPWTNDNGEERITAKVNWINSGSQSKPVEKSKMAAMNARFAGVLAQTAVVAPAKKDNLPF